MLYIIYTNNNPDVDREYPDFITQTIACALLRGEFYTAHKMIVFNVFISFTTGQSSAG